MAAEAFESGLPIVLAPGPRTTDRTAPTPDDTWDLPFATDWVYRGEATAGSTARF
ncbi:hypothetical protein [Streptomyces sp. NPDC102437]|uniref:hypothetical protein n=1 Tax=Streptomyces sp. NPDC102437 TaxID=3366175 RepID=UPI00381C5D8A